MKKSFVSILFLIALFASFNVQASSLFYSFNDSTTNKTLDPSAEIFQVADVMPSCPGGDSILFRFIANNLQYPISAMEKQIQGKVYIRFVVTKEGEIANIEVLRGVDPALDQEALRVTKLLGHWIPGKVNNQNVNVYYTLPIKFKFESSESKIKEPTTRYVTDDRVVLLDGKRLAVGFDLSTLKTADYEIDLIKPVTIEQMNDLKKEYGAGAENGVTLLTSIIKTPVCEKPDTMPQFPGGDNELMKFISQNLKYPTIAQENGFRGTVVAHFVVTTTGRIRNVKIIVSPHKSMSDEVIRVVKMLPLWVPGKKDGKLVDVIYTLPVKFKLN